MKHLYLLFLLIACISYAQLTPPTNLQAYYTDVDFSKTQMDLFNDLATKTVAKHTNFLSYTPGIWEAAKVTDEDPLNNANVLLIYGYNDADGNYVTDRSRSKTLNGGSNGTQWNREHTFPNSLGNPRLDTNGTNNAPYADAHNLRPSDIQMNQDRGNRKFDDGSGNATEVGSNWYPGDEWKGDVARIIMYMYLRYGSQCLPSFVTVGTTNSVDTNMINLLLEWNAEDPVSSIEDARNTYHENTSNTYAQGNRNPFIDNPYLATVIWGGSQATNRWGSNPPADTEAPTTPTNLMASNETATTVDLDWTASTDNVGVTAYNIYVDNAYYVSTNSSATSFTVTGLSSETTYEFAVLATDFANNASALSTPVNATTLAAGGGNACAFETFENMPAAHSQYLDRTWTGDDGGTWVATEARTDQVLNNRAIAIDIRGSSAGSITSPNLPNGVGSLTASTQRVFSGGTGNLDVKVNGNLVGTLPYSDTVQTTTISNINVTGNVTITISESTSGGDRVIIDDLTWTCYPALSTEDENLNNLKIFPNPLNGPILNISTVETIKYTVYNILGKPILWGVLNRNNQTVNVSNLKRGIYIIKMDSDKGSISKKLIK
ncbi:endonuclease [Hwangdonia lutea]|uniref:Endonuclease n=1 Tax=Hwangdonia lutea TaxID=3075823 RepID=A0AA97ENJ6_9FLAO|nr:endonuclease [Hwangdonia sp. SCSIO 19198]WOD44226.1 endonuclease [Hwangdonia sp. SCSIO 19198]